MPDIGIKPAAPAGETNVGVGLTDPCGNPLPLKVTIAFPPGLPSITMILDMLGIPPIPMPELPAPCPLLADALADAAESAGAPTGLPEFPA